MRLAFPNRTVPVHPWLIIVILLLALPRIGYAADSGPAILQDLKSFQQFASVLMIAAHPDDENTQLITYLARGRGYRMAYLSITRGDGGQNVLGPEFGAELGLIRTQELLAARRLDGGRQFFTRAIDFGFSKSPDETLKIWDHQQVLSDVVRVMRTFRPDVVVTRFSPTQTNTHGHHTASAILGLEAFKLTGDPNAFPDQIAAGLTPWQPKRIFINSGFGARGGGGGGAVTMDAGGIDPVLNESFASIASRSRAMHKTQGFGAPGVLGGRGAGAGGRGGGGGAAPQSFTLLAGDPAANDIMDGIDTTWTRVGPAGAAIAQRTADAIAKFDPKDPADSIPALLEIKRLVAAIPPDPVVSDRTQQLDRIIADCLGLTVSTSGPAEVVPGESMNLLHAAALTASFPVRWLAVRYPASQTELADPIDLKPNQPVTRKSSQTLPANTPVSQPYWLREEGTPGMYRVDDPTLIGRPENPPAFPVENIFEVAGQTLIIPDEPRQLSDAAADPRVASSYPRRLDVIAAVSLAFPFDVRLFAPASTRTVDVEVTAHRAATAGTLALDTPAGWKVEPASLPFHLTAIGDHVKLTFNVTAPAKLATATLSVHADVDGQRFTTARKQINYAHIPFLLLQPPARLTAVSLDLAIRGKTIGYLPGAGDSVAECLEQMGYTITRLTGADLTPEKLGALDAVVIGVRAFNTRDDLAANLQNLFNYAEAGGTVIEQYNRPDQLRNNRLAPFNLHLSGLRVTDETAPVKFLVPDSPALNTPNKITSADFDNWVQERNIYLPDQWDPHFTPILGMADPGESPPNSSLLIAQHGKGYFIYTSLVFFRQLPAGNPGAYRLFANLISLGKP